MDNDHLLARLSVTMSHSFFRTLATAHYTITNNQE